LFCFLVYRKAFDLCMLILHFVALLAMFTRSNSFFGGIFRVF
jgi:hypothetical protein